VAAEECVSDWRGSMCFLDSFVSGTRLSRLDVDTTRVRAAAAVTRARTRSAASVAVTAGVVGAAAAVAAVVGAHVAAVHKSDDSGGEEEDNVHDAESPASLEHGAGLVVDKAVVGSNDTDIAQSDVPVLFAADAHAVCVADIAQVVDGSDKGTEEEDVDESDKVGVGGGAVVAEEGEEGPGKSEHRDDEEDQDGVGSESVLLDETIDEPGEHAHAGDQSDDLKDPKEDEQQREEHFGGVVSAMRLCDDEGGDDGDLRPKVAEAGSLRQE